MSDILLDIGNSAIKGCLGWPQAQQLFRCARTVEALLPHLKALGPAGTPLWISSVASDAAVDVLSQALRAEGYTEQHWLRSPQEALGLQNAYAEASTLGVDRWLAMVAARQIHEGALLVIDAGTALTLDLVDENGCHQGGYIIPGVDLMTASLRRDTARVLFNEGLVETTAPGTSTDGCVGAGIWLTQVASVKTLMSQYPKYTPIITGGYGQALLALGIEAEHRPQLVLEGLAISAGIVAPCP